MVGNMDISPQILNLIKCSTTAQDKWCISLSLISQLSLPFKTLPTNRANRTNKIVSR